MKIKFALVVTLSLFLRAISCAQTASSPLGLIRLRDHGQTKSVIDTLSAQGATGIRIAEKRGVKFLVLDAEKEWSRPLRGGAIDLVFVSFSAYGSAGTIMEVGGARLGVVDSDIPGYAQLAADEKSRWRLLGIHVLKATYDTKLLGSLPVLTIRLDRTNGTWDLYHNAKLVAEDLPIDASIKHGKFVVKAGEEGAMINGLVQSDVNPLYADENGNGVDDAFEQQKRGRLLAKADGKADRKQLIADWRKHQRTSPPPALFVNLPQPD